MTSIARGRAVHGLALVAGALLWVFSVSPAHSESSFTLFESGQVRPLALSPDGTHLFAINTPDNRIEVFRVRKRGLTHVDSVPVGLEPVAVAARSNTEVWVVNHLSDSVSIIDVRKGRAHCQLFFNIEPVTFFILLTALCVGVLL
jgi:DNA-binding beta-propeller fold protein YncE